MPSPCSSLLEEGEDVEVDGVEVEPSSLGETIVEQDDNNIVIKNGIIIFFISLIINYFHIKVHDNKAISKIKL